MVEEGCWGFGWDADNLPVGLAEGYVTFSILSQCPVGAQGGVETVRQDLEPDIINLDGGRGGLEE